MINFDTRTKTAKPKYRVDKNDVICIDSDDDVDVDSKSISTQLTVNNTSMNKNNKLFTSSKSKFVPPQKKVSTPKDKPSKTLSVKPKKAQKKPSVKNQKTNDFKPKMVPTKIGKIGLKNKQPNDYKPKMIPTNISKIGLKNKQTEEVDQPLKAKPICIPCEGIQIKSEKNKQQNVAQIPTGVAKKTVKSSKSFPQTKPKDRLIKAVQPSVNYVPSTLSSQADVIKQKEPKQELLQQTLANSKLSEVRKTRPKDRPQKVVGPNAKYAKLTQPLSHDKDQKFVQLPLKTPQPCKSYEHVEPKNSQQNKDQPTAKLLQSTQPSSQRVEPEVFQQSLNSSQTCKIHKCRPKDRPNKIIQPPASNTAVYKPKIKPEVFQQSLNSSQTCKTDKCRPKDRPNKIIQPPASNTAVVVNNKNIVRTVGNNLIKPINSSELNTLDSHKPNGIKRPLKIVSPPAIRTHSKIQITESQGTLKLQLPGSYYHTQGLRSFNSCPSTPTKLGQLKVNQTSFAQSPPSTIAMVKRTLQNKFKKNLNMIPNSPGFPQTSNTTPQMVKFGCNSVLKTPKRSSVASITTPVVQNNSRQVKNVLRNIKPSRKSLCEYFSF